MSLWRRRKDYEAWKKRVMYVMRIVMESIFPLQEKVWRVVLQHQRIIRKSEDVAKNDYVGVFSCPM